MRSANRASSEPEAARSAPAISDLSWLNSTRLAVSEKTSARCASPWRSPRLTLR
jgi:hypothetical protein